MGKSDINSRLKACRLRAPGNFFSRKLPVRLPVWVVKPCVRTDESPHERLQKYETDYYSYGSIRLPTFLYHDSDLDDEGSLKSSSVQDFFIDSRTTDQK